MDKQATVPKLLIEGILAGLSVPNTVGILVMHSPDVIKKYDEVEVAGRNLFEGSEIFMSLAEWYIV